MSREWLLVGLLVTTTCTRHTSDPSWVVPPDQIDRKLWADACGDDFREIRESDLRDVHLVQTDRTWSGKGTATCTVTCRTHKDIPPAADNCARVSISSNDETETRYLAEVLLKPMLPPAVYRRVREIIGRDYASSDVGSFWLLGGRLRSARGYGEWTIEVGYRRKPS